MALNTGLASPDTREELRSRCRAHYPPFFLSFYAKRARSYGVPSTRRGEGASINQVRVRTEEREREREDERTVTITSLVSARRETEAKTPSALRLLLDTPPPPPPRPSITDSNDRYGGVRTEARVSFRRGCKCRGSRRRPSTPRASLAAATRTVHARTYSACTFDRSKARLSLASPLPACPTLGAVSRPSSSGQRWLECTGSECGGCCAPTEDRRQEETLSFSLLALPLYRERSGGGRLAAAS